MKVKSVMCAIFLMMLLSNPVFAQEKPEQGSHEEQQIGWHKEMVGGLNLTQASFVNWTQGGENSLAWQLNLNFRFVKIGVKTDWETSGKLTYGSAKLGGQEFRKAIDEIKVESVLTFKVGTRLNPFVATTAETQFAPGYDYSVDPKMQISSFMDPGYIRESAGINFVPNEVIRTRVGMGLKQTVANDFALLYTDDPGTPSRLEQFKNEAGAESVTDVNWKISKNSLFTSKLELFYAFGALDETDVKWDNVLSVKISKYFGINFNVILFYDKDISSRHQIKQSAAFGLTVNFL